jgi:hypothetical protein
MLALATIRLLRPILPGHALQQHLTDCAAYELVDRGSAPWLPRLTVKHVLGLRPLPAPDHRHTVFLDPAG